MTKTLFDPQKGLLAQYKEIQKIEAAARQLMLDEYEIPAEQLEKNAAWQTFDANVKLIKFKIEHMSLDVINTGLTLVTAQELEKCAQAVRDMNASKKSDVWNDVADVQQKVENVRMQFRAITNALTKSEIAPAVPSPPQTSHITSEASTVYLAAPSELLPS